MGVDRTRHAGIFSEIGLTAADEAVWHALLDAPWLDLPALSDRCGLEQIEVTTTLERLCEVGLVRSSAASPLGVVPADPGPALETQLIRTERALADRAAALAQIRSLVPELQKNYQRLAPSVDGRSAFEFLDNLDAIRAEVYRAAERTVSDIRSLDPGGGPSASEVESMIDSAPTQIATLRRGVCDRTVIDAVLLDDPDVFPFYSEFRSEGALYRALPDLTTRLSVFDSAQAIVAVDPANSGRGAIVVRTPSLVEALCYMFDQLWERASPIFDLGGDADIPNSRGARIVEMVALGMTDDRIARSLGVRPRTIGRDIAMLKDTLGVNSRAEIVAAAAKRGWL